MDTNPITLPCSLARAGNKPINSCHIMFIIVYSSFIILNYGFLYLLNLCLNLCIVIIILNNVYLLFLNL